MNLSIFIIFFVLVIFGSAFAMLMAYWKSVDRQKKADEAMRMRYEQYAADHGGSFVAGDVEMVVSGSFNEGGNHDVLSGNLAQGNPFQLYHQIEIRGSGKSRQILERTVCAVRVPDIMAQFIINSKLNERDIDMDNATYHGSQILQLEGNFSDFYSVYVPKGDQTQLLTLLAPDVMQYIFDNYADYDVEIKDHTLYIYAFQNLNADDALAMLESSEELVRRLKLRAQDARLVGDPDGTATLVAPAATGKQERTKLVTKRRIVTATVVSVIFFVFGMTYNMLEPTLSENTNTVIAFVVVGIFMGLFLIEPYLRYRRGNLRRRHAAVARPRNSKES